MQNSALTPADLDFLRNLVVAGGVPAAARKLGLSRHAVVAILAGARVRPGTLALAREAFAALRAPAAVA